MWLKLVQLHQPQTQYTRSSDIDSFLGSLCDIREVPNSDTLICISIVYFHYAV